jgi:hypothetical protein
MLRGILTCAVAGIFASAAAGQVSVTVYSSADPAGFDPQRFIAQQRQGHDPNFAWQVPGFAVIRDEREIDFKDGLNTISFTDVAAFIDPTTVSFADLTEAGATAVLEQQFLFDLVSHSKLLDRYLDRPITARVPAGDQVTDISGTLLSHTQGQLVLQGPGGVQLVPWNGSQVQLGELPGGLITRPTLQWLVRSAEGGRRKVRTAYQTEGITWRSDYNLVLNAEDTAADLGAWVTLMNLSGASYRDAQLKLIAGDVQRVQPGRGRYPPMAAQAVRAEVADAAFEEKSFYEYHLYTLPRRTTIAQNTTQQIALFPTVDDVAVEKVLVYYGLPQAAHWGVFPRPMTDRDFGNQSNKKVDVYIRFENRQDNKLGIPLPRGKVRVFKLDDADGSLEFVGEDLIDHTPRNQTVLIRTGQSFDVTGERTQTNYTVNIGGHVITESFRIELSNAKDRPQKVIIKENLYRWVNWEILQKSDDFTKVDARTIHFEVTVPAEGKKVVEYTVRYTW